MGINNLYIIAGIKVQIVSSDPEGLRNLAYFRINRSSFGADPLFSKADLKIAVKRTANIHKPRGTVLIDGEAKWVKLPGGNLTTSIYVCDLNTGEILCRADASRDWSRAVLSILENNKQAEHMAYSFLCEVLFRNCIILKKGMAIHASAISWEGIGIAFTAPSGTGKSTQARLWGEYMGASVLNDDRPVLKLEDSEPEKQETIVYGTPWSGTNIMFQNNFAPLRALVLLEQAPKNSIRRLNSAAAAAKILPRCFLPYYDQNFMEISLNCLSDVLAEVPVYELKCRPDQEAVKLLHECVIQK